jgi:hypothetical protein
MRIQVGIVGLLVVLFIVLGMTRPQYEEGYATQKTEIPEAILVLLFIIFCPAILMFGSMVRL